MARIDRNKLAAEISLKIREDNEAALRTKAFAKEVAEYWKNVAWPTSTGNHGPGVHPYDTGAYRESITVSQARSKETGRFVSAWDVTAHHPHANFIEFGTGRDKPGSRSPWGPNTPTPEFAPAAKTAIHFRGTAP